jgi:hypothetical protein
MLMLCWEVDDDNDDLQLLKLEVYPEDDTGADEYGNDQDCWAFTTACLHFALLFTIRTISSNTEGYELCVKHYML